MDELDWSTDGPSFSDDFDEWNSAARAVYESDAVWEFDERGDEFESALASCLPQAATRIRTLIARIDKNPSSVTQEVDLNHRYALILGELRTPAAAATLTDSDRALVELAALSSRALLPLAPDAGKLRLRVDLPQDASQVSDVRDLLPHLEVGSFLAVQDAVLSEAALALLESRQGDALDLVCMAIDMAAVLRDIPLYGPQRFSLFMLGNALAGVEFILAMSPEFSDSPRLTAALSDFDPQADLRYAIEGDRESSNLVFDWLQGSIRRIGARMLGETLSRAFVLFENDRALYQQDIDSILYALTLKWPASQEAIRRTGAKLEENKVQRLTSSLLIRPYGHNLESTLQTSARLQLVRLALSANEVGLEDALANGALNFDPFTGGRFLKEENELGATVLSSPGPNGVHEAAELNSDDPPDWTDDIQITLYLN